MLAAEDTSPPPDAPDYAPLADTLALYKGLVEMCTLINAITDYHELLNEIMEIARRVMRAEGSVLILQNEGTGELEIVIARTITGEVLKPHLVIPRQSLAGWTFEHGLSVSVPDAYADPRFHRALAEEAGVRTRALLCVPLLRRGTTPIGVLQVLNAMGGGRTTFSATDQEALEAFASLAATAIDKLRFVEQQERRARFEQELTIATEIQKSFLPASLPVRADMAFAAQYRPALDVGGDFYDLFEVGPDELYFVIGDVAGKGVPAALLMAQSLSLLRLIIVPGIAPAEALQRWNQMLCLRTLRGLFVTATLGRVVPSQGLVEAASAGHLPPWLVREGPEGAGNVEDIMVRSGPPLAVVPQAAYQPSFLRPLPGEWLVFYTDGLTDSAPGPTGRRLDGAGARRMLEKGFASPQQLVATLLGGEAAYRGESPPQDDLTLLAFGFRR